MTPNEHVCAIVEVKVITNALCDKKLNLIYLRYQPKIIGKF